MVFPRIQTRSADNNRSVIESMLRQSRILPIVTIKSSFSRQRLSIIQRLQKLLSTLHAMGTALNTIVWLAVITTQDFRFQYAVYVIALIAPALLFAPRQQSQK